MSHRYKGYNAAKNGESMSSCPFPVGTKARVEWRAGFHNYNMGRLPNGNLPPVVGKESNKAPKTVREGVEE